VLELGLRGGVGPVCMSFISCPVLNSAALEVQTAGGVGVY